MSMTKCHVCGRSVFDGFALYRQNEKGVDPIMACKEHSKAKIDPLVEEITQAIQSDNERIASAEERRIELLREHARLGISGH